MYKVLFYNPNNKEISEVEEFIDKESPKAQEKIINYLELLQEYGSFLQMPYSKKIHEKLWELRVKISSKNIRILYTKNKNTFTILSIFNKKTQKTPQKELSKALKRIEG